MSEYVTRFEAQQEFANRLADIDMFAKAVQEALESRDYDEAWQSISELRSEIAAQRKEGLDI